MEQGQVVWYGILYLFAAFGLAMFAAQLAALWMGERRIWRGGARLWIDSTACFDELLRTLQQVKHSAFPDVQVYFTIPLTAEQTEKLAQLGLLPEEKKHGRESWPD